MRNRIDVATLAARNRQETVNRNSGRGWRKELQDVRHGLAGAFEDPGRSTRYVESRSMKWHPGGEAQFWARPAG